jgi:hypothetical protein
MAARCSLPSARSRGAARTNRTPYNGCPPPRRHASGFSRHKQDPALALHPGEITASTSQRTGRDLARPNAAPFGPSGRDRCLGARRRSSAAQFAGHRALHSQWPRQSATLQSPSDLHNARQPRSGCHVTAAVTKFRASRSARCWPSRLPLPQSIRPDGCSNVAHRMSCDSELARVLLPLTPGG